MYGLEYVFMLLVVSRCRRRDPALFRSSVVGRIEVSHREHVTRLSSAQNSEAHLPVLSVRMVSSSSSCRLEGSVQYCQRVANTFVPGIRLSF